MAVIGNFTVSGNVISGTVRTLTVSMKARLNPIDRTSRDALDFRIMSGMAKVGAGFNAPINAALWPSQNEGDYDLLWNRPKRDA